MKSVRILTLVLVMAFMLTGSVWAAQVDCDTTYCFTPQDFSEEALRGICITELPSPETGTVMLGNRVLRSGDILTAEQLSQMTFSPIRTETDTSATVTYLPIYENRVERSTAMTISIRGKEDKAPVAEDLNLETYKNLPNTGALKVQDPEGEKLTFTLIRAPKRGQVDIREDGSFTYTPKKNKVGVDSFVYTATDPAGNVSRQATVTVQILKPAQKTQYTDTIGNDCRFAAEWMKNTGLFTGETIDGQQYFFPDKTVSRGDFLAMAVKALDIAPEEQDYSAIPTQVPMWLKPYVGAALRSGLLDGWEDTWNFDAPMTQQDAAVLLQNALNLDAEQSEAIAVMGGTPEANTHLTRATAAQILYQSSILADITPSNR